MSSFEDAVIQRIKQLEREVERLQKWERPIVITDHGALTGLGDNDHPQYLLTTGKAADSDKLDGIDSTAFVQASKLGVWSAWTPTYTGWTSGTVTGTFKYSVIGNIVFLLIDMTAGTSNATNAYIDLPVNADLNASYGGTLGLAMDNGTVLTQATKWYIGGTSQTIVFNTDMSNGAWTASGTKRVRCLAIYAKGT